jgi:hypothetical protein
MTIDFNHLDSLVGTAQKRNIFKSPRTVAMVRLYYKRIPTCRIADTLNLDPDTIRKAVAFAESQNFPFLYELAGKKAEALEAELKKEIGG